MEVITVSDAKTQEGTSKIFQGGQVRRQNVVGDSNEVLRIAVINFSPGATTVFHTHTFNQTLYVTKGKGIVATEKEEITVTPGTFIFIPAGENHWHGATKDTAFSHIAIMPPGETSF